MKIPLSFLIIGLLFLTTCTTQSSSPPTNDEATPPTNEESPAITEPEPEPEPEPQLVEVPLSYEVVESFLEQDSFNERRQLIIDGEVIQDEVVEVFYPIGCVTLKNTDAISGAFTVHFIFYTWDKGTPEHLIEVMRTEYISDQTVELQPDTIGTVKYPAHDVELDSEWDDWSWEFEVIPGTKLIEQQEK
jgi:hypothetical protein